MEFEPLSDHIGARVVGLDHTKPVIARDAGQLREAFYKYRLLLFRQGPITDDQHIHLMRALGNVIVETSAGSPVTYASPDPNEYVGGRDPFLYHSDYMMTESGALQSISLYAIEMERDEPTLFSNQVNAARSLPPDIRARVEGLELMQCFDASTHAETRRSRLSNKQPDDPDSMFPRAVHPLLGPHPYTGEEMLNVSQFMSSHIVGMSDQESDEIFDLLEPYQYGADNTYAHHWQVDDLVIWDNIGLQHARSQIQAPYGRRLRRVAINPMDVAELLGAAAADVTSAASRGPSARANPSDDELAMASS